MTAVETGPDVESLYLRVMGVVVEVVPKDEEMRARLAHQWSRAVVDVAALPQSQPRAGRKVHPMHGPLETEDLRDYELTTQVTLAALEATAGDRLNLHAGALADDEGRVLAIVGPSGAGKTTATRVLAAEFHYLSDETASVAPDRVVLPHPKPLSVVLDPERPRHKEQMSPDDLGLGPTPESGVLTRLVVLHRGGEGPRGLVRLDPVDGALQIVEQSSSLDLLPTPLPTLFGLIRECGGIFALEYDEIGDHVGELQRLLASDLEPDPDLDPDLELVPHPRTDAALVDVGSDRLQRTPWVDAVEVGDDVVVLVGRRAVRLAGLLGTLWVLLSEPCTVDELVAGAERLHGEHPDAVALVKEAVSALIEENLAGWGSLA
jgi:hypothetical protein